jgi:ribokinase
MDSFNHGSLRRCACVGNLTQDHLLFTKRLPEIDDVAFVLDRVDCVGGRGALVALTVAALGVPVDLCTVVGDRAPAHDLLFLQESGVGVEGISKASCGEGLFEVFAAIGAHEENCISFFVPKKIPFEVAPQHVRLVARADVLYFSTHKRSFNRELIKALHPDQKVIHNLTTYMLEDAEYLDLLLSSSNVLVGNEGEVNYLLHHLGLQQAPQVMDKYRKVECLIATQGKSGAQVFTRDGVVSVPARFARVVAPIGAGDAFAAGIVYGVCAGFSYAAGARLGVALGAESVQSRYSYPDLNRILETRGAFIRAALDED